MGIYKVPENLVVVNEVYFGQTPGITRCFEAFSAFRSKYVTSKKFFMGNIDADHDPMLQKFIDEIEREFGFYSFSFIIEDNDTPNMCTIIPFFRGTDIKKALSITKDGYKFKKEAKVSTLTIAPTGLLFNDAFTDREIFAIFLHEMGHSFQDFITDKMNFISKINNVVFIYRYVLPCMLHPILGIKNITTLTVLSNPVMGQITDAFNKISISERKTIYSYFNKVHGLYKNIQKIVQDTVISFVSPLLLTMPFTSFTKDLLSLVFDPIGTVKRYGGEQLADRFAGYYGFGNDLSTSLLKLNDSGADTSMKSKLNKIPIFAHIHQTCLIPMYIVDNLLDCHPGTASRIKNLHESLENYMKNPQINPKLKKELEQELKEIDKNIDEFYEEATKVKNPRFLKQKYDLFIYKTCGGDLKHKMLKNFFKHDEDTDETYNKFHESTDYIDNITLK